MLKKPNYRAALIASTLSIAMLCSLLLPKKAISLRAETDKIDKDTQAETTARSEKQETVSTTATKSAAENTSEQEDIQAKELAPTSSKTTAEAKTEVSVPQKSKQERSANLPAADDSDPENKGSGINLDAEHFPDENFREFVKLLTKHTYHKEINEGEEIPAKVFAQTSKIDLRRILPINEESAQPYVFEKIINDFKGIEYFTELKILKVRDYQGSELDLSKNTKLTELDLSIPSKLSKLILGEKPELTKLIVNSLQLSLDKDYPIELVTVPLTELDLSACPALNHLDLTNTKISNLDLTQSTLLMSVYLENLPLTALNLSRQRYLQRLNVNGTQISNLNLQDSSQLKELYAENAKLKHLDISNSKQLQLLNVNNNELTSLNLKEYTELKLLWCLNNPFLSLDVPSQADLLFNTTKSTIDSDVYYNFKHEYKDSVIFVRKNPETGKYEAKLKDIFTDEQLAKLQKYNDDKYFHVTSDTVMNSYIDYDASRQTLVLHNAQEQNPDKKATISFLYQTGRAITDELTKNADNDAYAKKGLEQFKFKLVNVGKIDGLYDKVFVADLDMLKEQEKAELTARILDRNSHIKPYVSISYEQKRKVKFTFSDNSVEYADLEQFAKVDTDKQLNFNKEQGRAEISKLQYLSQERKDKWHELVKRAQSVEAITNVVSTAKQQDQAAKDILDLTTAQKLSDTQKQTFIAEIEKEDEANKFLARVEVAKAVAQAISEAKQAVQTKIATIQAEIAKPEYEVTEAEKQAINQVLEEVKTSLNNQVANVFTTAEVETHKNKALASLEAELTKFKEKQAYKKSLKSAKEQAKQAINEQAKLKAQEIAKFQLATSAEKETAKKKLEQVQNDALTAIDRQTDLAGITNAKADGLAKIKQVQVESDIINKVKQEVANKHKAKLAELNSVDEKIPTREEYDSSVQRLNDLLTSIDISGQNFSDFASLENFKNGAIQSFDLINFEFEVRQKVIRTINNLQYLEQVAKTKHINLVKLLPYTNLAATNLTMWRIEALAKILDAQANRNIFVDNDTNPDATIEEKAEFKERVKTQTDTEKQAVPDTTLDNVREKGDKSVRTIIQMLPQYSHKPALRAELKNEANNKIDQIKGGSLSSTSKQYWQAEVEKIQKEAEELLKNPNLTKEQATQIKETAKEKIAGLELKELPQKIIRPGVSSDVAAETITYIRGHRFKPTVTKTGEPTNSVLGLSWLLSAFIPLFVNLLT